MTCLRFLAYTAVATGVALVLAALVTLVGEWG